MFQDYFTYYEGKLPIKPFFWEDNWWMIDNIKFALKFGHVDMNFYLHLSKFEFDIDIYSH